MARLPITISKSEPKKDELWLKPDTLELHIYKPNLGGWTRLLNKELTMLETEAADAEKPIVRASSYLDFPAVGNADKIYIDTSTNRVYAWDADGVNYVCVGVGYNPGDEVLFDGNGVQ